MPTMTITGYVQNAFKSILSRRGVSVDDLPRQDIQVFLDGFNDFVNQRIDLGHARRYRDFDIFIADCLDSYLEDHAPEVE